MTLHTVDALRGTPSAPAPCSARPLSSGAGFRMTRDGTGNLLNVPSKP